VTLRCYIKLKLDKDINRELKTIITNLLCWAGQLLSIWF